MGEVVSADAANATAAVNFADAEVIRACDCSDSIDS